MQENTKGRAGNLSQLTLRAVHAEQGTDQHQLSASCFLLFTKRIWKNGKSNY
jgi:hypothetical protein